MTTHPLRDTLMLLAFFTAFSLTLSAQIIRGKLNLQDSTQRQYITKKNGEIVLGRILSMGSQRISLFHNPDTIQLATSDVAEIEVAKVARNQKSYRSQKQNEPSWSMDLMYNQTAVPLPKGAERFYNAMFMHSSFEYGVSDHFTVGAAWVTGMPFFGITARGGTAISKNAWVGVSTYNQILPFTFIKGGTGVIGTTAANITLGNTENFFSAGAGMFYVYGFGNMALRAPVIRLGAFKRISKKFAILTDTNIILFDKADDDLPGVAFPNFIFRLGKPGMHVDLGINSIAITSYTPDLPFPIQPIFYLGLGAYL